MAEDALRMVRLAVDARRLLSLAGKSLPPQNDDLGFLAHQLLASLFGEGTVQPFRTLEEQRRNVEILGYTIKSEEELRSHAETFSDPLAHGGVDWSGFAVKPMPDGWAPERLLGFEVRICPVVRLASARSVAWKGEPRDLQAGAEMDAFVHARHLNGEPGASRETAYREWLQQRLAPAAELLEAGMAAFRRLRLLRRTHEPSRVSRLLERPEALMRGTLVIRDPAAFAELLARGVGRHRAYGFGMLLLRPPG